MVRQRRSNQWSNSGGQTNWSNSGGQTKWSNSGGQTDLEGEGRILPKRLRGVPQGRARRAGRVGGGEDGGGVGPEGLVGVLAEREVGGGERERERGREGEREERGRRERRERRERGRAAVGGD